MVVIVIGDVTGIYFAGAGNVKYSVTCGLFHMAENCLQSLRHVDVSFNINVGENPVVLV